MQVCSLHENVSFHANQTYYVFNSCRVLSGKSAFATRQQAAGTSPKSNLDMVQAWEDRTLSGKRKHAFAKLTTQDKTATVVRNKASSAPERRLKPVADRAHSPPSPPAAAKAIDTAAQVLGQDRRMRAASQKPAASNSVKNAAIQKAEKILAATQQEVGEQAQQQAPSAANSNTASRSHRVPPNPEPVKAKAVASAATDVSQNAAQPKAKKSAKAELLEKKAAKEEKQANKLVKYANVLAQKIIKEEALNEMKKWLADHAGDEHQQSNRKMTAAQRKAMHKANIRRSRPVSPVLQYKSALSDLRQTVDKIQSHGLHGKQVLRELNREVNLIETAGEKIAIEANSQNKAAAPASVVVSKP
jgi:hypothetical protein